MTTFFINRNNGYETRPRFTNCRFTRPSVSLPAEEEEVEGGGEDDEDGNVVLLCPQAQHPAHGYIHKHTRIKFCDKDLDFYKSFNLLPGAMVKKAQQL